MSNEELIAQYYDGDRLALHALLEQNTGFIKSTVKEFASRYAGYIYSDDTKSDLFQIASLEFYERFMKGGYKVEYGTVLTYIKPYLEAEMRKYIAETSSFFKLSAKSFTLITQCQRLNKKWYTSNEIAKELGISERLVQKCLRYSFTYKTIIYGSEKDSYGLDYIEECKLCVNEQHPDDKVYVKWRRIYLKELFDLLSAKEKQLIGGYFGVFGYERMSDRELGDFLLMTRDGVNKGIVSALEKLRDMYYADSMLKRWREVHWLVWDTIGE